MSHTGHTHDHSGSPCTHQHGPVPPSASEAARTLPLRIAVVQFQPKLGQVEANINKAREICSRIQPRSVDVICFPEMIFTGYNFPNSEAISPYLELPLTGPTSQFCANLSKKLQCHVLAGYPARLPEAQTRVDEISGIETKLVGANSAVVYGPDGELVGEYRKTNLFYTDETWAVPGNGFVTFTLASPLRAVTLGICMDLNCQPPAVWTLADGPYELANHALSKSSNVLILLNAWIDSGNEPEQDKDWQTLNFWAARLRPLWAAPEGQSEADVEAEDVDTDADETIVVVCNRAGDEDGVKFAGTSALFSMQRGSGKPRLLDAMGRTEEGLRIWSILVKE